MYRSRRMKRWCSKDTDSLMFHCYFKCNKASSKVEKIQKIQLYICLTWSVVGNYINFAFSREHRISYWKISCKVREYGLQYYNYSYFLTFLENIGTVLDFWSCLSQVLKSGCILFCMLYYLHAVESSYLPISFLT